MNGVTPQAPNIGTGSIFKEYPDSKSIIGGGNFSVVFLTRRDQSRLAVKVIHCPKDWRNQIGKLETEVMPLDMSARKQWKHVISANKWFVNEHLAKELKELLRPSSIDGRLLASPIKAFWTSLQAHLTNTNERRWFSCLIIQMPMADMSLRWQLQHWGQEFADDIRPAVCERIVAAHWFSDLVSGVQELQEAGIMHRDL